MTYLENFIQDYITTALWSTTGSEEDDFEYLEEEYSKFDLAPETLAEMKRDCNEFIGLIAGIEIETDHPGHDFWLTRNGHGAGFWDGDYPVWGDKLTEISKEFGECDLYVGDDNKIYII